MRNAVARGLRLAVNTQTPLVRFREGAPAKASARSLAQLQEGEDYKLTTGGVTRMLLPLLRRWLAAGTLSRVEWIALGSHEGPRVLDHDGVTLSFVGFDEDDKAGYALVKERMWAILNSNPSTPAPHGEGGIPDDAWRAYEAYQDASAAAIGQAADRMGGLDLLYVHDFQQIGVAEAWRGERLPRVFHLHTPFPSVLPAGWAEWFVARLRNYDAVVVSTARYAQNLRAAGLDRPIHVVAPFIDPSELRVPAPDEVATFRARFDVGREDEVVLSVGRMDPVKAQDRLIRALPEVLRERPRARLVLVGNGSFSSSKRGGLGLSKGEQWRAALETLAKELGVADRVTFTGHLGDDLLPGAYGACKVFCLPSSREGFGLATIEAWRQRRPVVVSDRAGVAELVEDGVNGRVLDCADAAALAGALVDLLARPDLDAMGEAGLAASEVATLPVGAASLERVFASALEEEYAVA